MAGAAGADCWRSNHAATAAWIDAAYTIVKKIPMQQAMIPTPAIRPLTKMIKPPMTLLVRLLVAYFQMLPRSKPPPKPWWKTITISVGVRKSRSRLASSCHSEPSGEPVAYEKPLEVVYVREPMLLNTKVGMLRTIA